VPSVRYDLGFCVPKEAVLRSHRHEKIEALHTIYYFRNTINTYMPMEQSHILSSDIYAVMVLA
jgi:hypothetical protein